MMRIFARVMGVVITTICVALLIALHPVFAQNEEPYSGEALCLPDAYPAGASDCLALGPSTTLSDWSKVGLTYPQRPLPAHHPPADLTVSPVNIAKINLPPAEAAQLYGSLDDAVAGSSPVRSINPGLLRYVSYIQVQKVNGKAYVQLKSGEWMRASPAAYSSFQGLIFTRNPSNSFGWIFDNTHARTGPGYQYPEVGDWLYREASVQIYQIKPAGGVDWYQIGIDRWVERRYIRQVRINTTPPPGVDNNRWIEINLYDQTVSVYQDGRLIFATLIATGLDPLYTRPGLFKIFQKKPLETMQGATNQDRSDYYYLQDVPWTMYFDEARALHGAYWRAWYGIPQSHGCVNMSIGDSAWLFSWAKEGDWVYVWDPSGQTPTDPKFYGAGGA